MRYGLVRRNFIVDMSVGADLIMVLPPDVAGFTTYIVNFVLEPSHCGKATLTVSILFISPAT